VSDWHNMKIVAAACFKEMLGSRPFSGMIFTIPPPARHHDIVHMMHNLGIPQDQTIEQGFLTDTGKFVRRKPACMIAEHAGQLEGRTKTGPSDTLFSEDLW
jgi:hypothetical protein